ncbi:MAG: DUF805 domain-containing protein [Alphaproteobacteria bacterium]|nr:DUF805 domain-containing protein [Alphaproteobacteria bacterium]
MNVDELEKLAKLKKKGLLSEDEFSTQKETLLKACKDKSTWFYFKRALTKDYFNFSKRARRKEYWGVVLWNYIFSLLLYALLIMTGSGFILSIYLLYSLYTIIPGLSVLVRRLHDVNMRGWWILTIIVPIIMIFVKGNKGSNRFGLDPLA